MRWRMSAFCWEDISAMVPCLEESVDYRNLRDSLYDLVAQINEKFSTLDYAPVDYFLQVCVV